MCVCEPRAGIGTAQQEVIVTRAKRFERAAAALAAGRKVSVAVEELPLGVQAWLAELRSYVTIGHTDPGDEVGYKVYVTVIGGRAIARAKQVYHLCY